MINKTELQFSHLSIHFFHPIFSQDSWADWFSLWGERKSELSVGVERNIDIIISISISISDLQSPLNPITHRDAGLSARCLTVSSIIWCFPAGPGGWGKNKVNIYSKTVTLWHHLELRGGGGGRGRGGSPGKQTDINIHIIPQTSDYSSTLL